MSSRPPLPYTANPLDRASERRGDAAWLAAKRQAPGTLILPMWRMQPFLLGAASASHKELGFVDSAGLAAVRAPEGQEIFLGLDGEKAVFARDVSILSDPAGGAWAEFGHFSEARAAAAALPLPEIAIMGQAKALFEWHARHGFCPNCGAPTIVHDGGYRRLCQSCETEQFPRTDPVVIMLVTRGEYCLLANNKRFAGTRNYSALAGFIEPGEAIEDAVRREVAEEVGIRIGQVRFFAAQPWPYPYSLMLGCYAEAESEEITVDGTEIVAARWVSKTDLRKILAGEKSGIELPRTQAIAFHLIRGWAEV